MADAPDPDAPSPGAPDADELALRLLHRGDARPERGDPTVRPPVLSTTFHQPGEPSGPDCYGRPSNPTWRDAEGALGLLEGADCALLPSGMAAIAALFMTALRAGDALVLPSDGYYNTRTFARRFLAPLGVELREHPTADFANAPFAGAALVLAETPSNPGLDACDLALVAERAHAAGARLAVDNTTMTAYLQRPLDLGADVVVAADTKAPGGHSDVLMGHLATRDESLLEAAREWRTLSGSIPGPFEAWLLLRGLETLELRLERMQASALAIAERLREHPAVRAVRHPGLEDDPAHRITAGQASGFGFLVGVTLADAPAAERFLSGCGAIAETTSFGSVHTAGERRARWGDAVDEGFVRLSIGCEPVEPLWRAMDAALRA